MSIWIPVLFTPEPYVIRDPDNERDDKSIATVERFDCTEAIFEIIASRGIEENTIEFKPESATANAYKYQIRQNWRETQFTCRDSTP
jgi:hypothetical protein